VENSIRPCPLCAAPLQALRGRDGWTVDERVVIDERGQLIPGFFTAERRRMDVVLACPGCEYAQIGTAP
jgi:hypothetical protein